MFLAMQDLNLPISSQFCPNLINFAKKFLLDATASSAPTTPPRTETIIFHVFIGKLCKLMQIAKLLREDDVAQKLIFEKSFEFNYPQKRSIKTFIKIRQPMIK